jgi:hypothetical protein
LWFISYYEDGDITMRICPAKNESMKAATCRKINNETNCQIQTIDDVIARRLSLLATCNRIKGAADSLNAYKSHSRNPVPWGHVASEKSGPANGIHKTGSNPEICIGIYLEE